MSLSFASIASILSALQSCFRAYSDAEVGTRRAVAAKDVNFRRVGTADKPIESAVDLLLVSTVPHLDGDKGADHPLGMTFMRRRPLDVRALSTGVPDAWLPARRGVDLTVHEERDLLLIGRPRSTELTGLLAFNQIVGRGHALAFGQVGDIVDFGQALKLENRHRPTST